MRSGAPDAPPQYAYIAPSRGPPVSPGIGLMKRRLETEESAVSLAVSDMSKRHPDAGGRFEALETLFHKDSGDWYVALGWDSGAKRAVVRMDSVLGTVTDVDEKQAPRQAAGAGEEGRPPQI